ncbi:TPA: CDP-glycerol glycerophosphotransferase family protein, partial [Streptococcus suis]
LMSFLIKSFLFFIPRNNNLILFNSFAGRNFDDSPRVLYEKIKLDNRFKNYELVWAFHKPEDFNNINVKKVKTDSLKYFIVAGSAKVWITNSSMERGLNFKKNNTIYLNTWHGTPIKFMGSDLPSDNKSFAIIGKNNTDIMLSQSYYETEIFSRSFNLPHKVFLEVGLPRNDMLQNINKDKINAIKRELGIKSNKKIILYCPTFREYERNITTGILMAPPFNSSKWIRELEEYVILIRAHYEVSRVLDFSGSTQIIDVTNYPVLNDLFSIADCLVSDYSSVFFDFSITGKPMFHYTYDFEKYSSERGLYFDIRKFINGSSNEDELIEIIKKMDYDAEKLRTVAFRKNYVNFFGNATEKTIDYLYEKLLE